MADGIPIIQVSGGIDTEMVQDNKIMVADVGFLHQVMTGNITGHIYRKVKGHSHSVGTIDQEISALGTTITTTPFGNWPAAAAGVIIVSDDATDNVTGIGARSIIVRGLDANWEETTVTIIPTGLTPTTVTAQTFIRINELEVLTAGSHHSNTGVITASIGGVDIMEMYEDHTTSEGGRFTIPANAEGHFQNLEGSAVGTKAMTYHVFCRDTTVTDAAFKLRHSWHSLDGGYRPDGLLDIFTEKTDVIFIGHSILGGAACSVSIEGFTKVV